MAKANVATEREAVDRALGQEADYAEPTFSEEVRELRHRLQLTQEAFCQRFGIPLANLRNWEQPGRSTKPDTAARLLIAMIAVDPERVAAIIAKASHSSQGKTEQVKGAA